jgi:8-amino-7-oxononanoate synthase
MFENELLALEKSNRLRRREIYPEDMIDLASNDYLGLSSNNKTLDKAYKTIKQLKYHTPRASMMVNGYSPIHKQLEDHLKQLNGFEDAMVMPNGFCANVAMIEAFCRKGDLLLIDEKYHASGILASKLVAGDVVFFRHNDANDLREKIFVNSFKRIIIAVEGIYSMDGDLLSEDIINVADEFEALLIVDEAHSSGVVGNGLLGIFDHYMRPPKSHYVKMGTLGKAYGSFGAYICASKEVISYLENRAKPAIYTTAPSLFECALSYENMLYVQENIEQIKLKILKRQELFANSFGIRIDSLIGVIPIGDISKTTQIKQKLIEQNILIGAIRPPTVPSAILRIIPNCGVKLSVMKEAFAIIRGLI